MEKLRIEKLLTEWSHVAIHGCPGRFIVDDPKAAQWFSALLLSDVRVRCFSSPKARDPVFILPLEDGGIISYQKEDAQFLHTLNTFEGFQRKLKALDLQRDFD